MPEIAYCLTSPPAEPTAWFVVKVLEIAYCLTTKDVRRLEKVPKPDSNNLKSNSSKYSSSQRTLAAYVFAFMAIAGIALLRHAAQWTLNERGKFLLFFPVILLASIIGGVGPGMMALLLGGLLSIYLFFPPFYDLEVYEPADYVNIMTYLIAGIMIIVIGEWQRMAEQRALDNAEKNESQKLRLEKEIDERLEIQLTLFDQLSVLKAITANAADALFLMDREGRITFSNPAAEVIFGWNTDDLRGQYLHDLMHERDENGNQRPREECPLHEVLRTGDTLRNYEDVMVHREGHFIPVVCSCASINPPTKNEAAVLVVHDITDRKRAEAMLQESHRILEALMDCVPEGIILADAPSSRVQRISEEAVRLLGTSREQVENDSLAQNLPIDLPLLKPETKEPVLFEESPLNRAILHGESLINAEYILMALDGRTTPISCNAAPIRDHAGNITGGILSFRDIRQLKEAEEKLRDQFYSEKQISETLQRAILPPRFDPINGIGVNARYLPAQSEAMVGGDFYDIFQLESGLVAVVIGDVAGKGVEAAVKTAMVKHSLRAYAYENPDPAEVLTRLNRVIQEEMPDGLITLFYGLVDIQERELLFCNAGHEPPLWLIPNPFRVVEIYRPAVALGCNLNGVEYRRHRIEFEAGHRLLLYTDGITEARKGREFFEMDRLKEVLASCTECGPDTVLDRIIDRVIAFSDGTVRDDCAVMLLSIEE